VTCSPPRVPSIDGLRGVLALYVMTMHFLGMISVRTPLPNPHLAVMIFFLMSGYVLTPIWDGDYLSFLARRFLRLWPVYAFCLATGALLLGVAVSWSDFLWYPLTANATVSTIDFPMWSLLVEAWMMLAMPLIAWSGKSLPRLAFGITCFVALSHFVPLAMNGTLFILGGYCAKWRFNFAPLNTRVPQWLGKVSYSLYLTHWLVFKVCCSYLTGTAYFAAFPTAMLIGYLVWSTIERRSVRLSREFAQFVKQRKAIYGDRYRGQRVRPSACEAAGRPFPIPGADESPPLLGRVASPR